VNFKNQRSAKFQSVQRGGLPPTAQVECVPIETIKLNPKNARTHSRLQRRRIAASIRKFGFVNPIIVDENGMVLAGHGRLYAAQEEGLTHVPVICLNHLTPLQKRAYLIADNKIAEQAGWDRQMLAVELGELVELLPFEEMDISITGFEVAEFDLLRADMASPANEPADKVPALPTNPTTRPADLWCLGSNHLLCGDAQSAASFTKLMGGVSAAAVFCDPPYNVPSRLIGGRGKIQHADFAFASGEMSKVEYRAFLRRTLRNAIRSSSDGALHFVCIDWRHVADLIAVAEELYGGMVNLVVWNKSNAGQGSLYRSQHELIGVFRVGEASHRNNIQLGRFGRNRSNVWTYAGVNTFGRGRMEALSAHPTVKPIALVADALLDCTAPGDVVLDQFVGSGTTILAAEKTGRIAYGIEYEPGYVDVAIQRWQALTKRDAVLQGDGRTFDEVTAARTDAKEMPATVKVSSRPTTRGGRAHA
jgi:DNA modification methylase